MKTVLPFRGRTDRTEHAVFYHGKEISITLEVRPVPAHWNSSKTVNGVETPVKEMEFFVLRFPTGWYKRIEAGTFSSHIGEILNRLGAERELLVLPYAHYGGVFEKLARSGFFRYTERLAPLPNEGMYLPFYYTPVRIHQRISNIVGVTMSIPQVSWMAYQERKEKKKQTAGEKK